MKILSLTLRHPLPNGEFHFDAADCDIARVDDGFTIELLGFSHWQHGSNVADCLLEVEAPAKPELECELCGHRVATAQALASHKRNKHK